MASEETANAEVSRSVASEAISELLSSANADVLRALIENPQIEEAQLCLLLERKDLSSTVLSEIAKLKKWRASYRVRRSLAAHPHTPRLLAIRMLRDLHLMDLVKISQLTSASVELRRLAEERVIARLNQLPLGQKLTLARRGSARVAGELIQQGPEQVARIALDNPYLTESHVLKCLAKQALPERTVTTVAIHEKWSKLVNVRVALLRHPNLTYEYFRTFAADLPKSEIQNLLEVTHLAASARNHLRRELARRDQAEA